MCSSFCVTIFSNSCVYTRVLTRFNSLPVHNRVPIHQWMWVESIRVEGRSHWRQIRVESGLEPSCEQLHALSLSMSRLLNLPDQFTVRATHFHSEMGLSHSELEISLQSSHDARFVGTKRNSRRLVTQLGVDF